MKLTTALMSAAAWSAVFVQCLCMTQQGKRAYFEQVRPIVSQYQNALHYGEDE